MFWYCFDFFVKSTLVLFLLQLLKNDRKFIEESNIIQHPKNPRIQRNPGFLLSAAYSIYDSMDSNIPRFTKKKKKNISSDQGGHHVEFMEPVDENALLVDQNVEGPAKRKEKQRLGRSQNHQKQTNLSEACAVSAKCV